MRSEAQLTEMIDDLKREKRKIEFELKNPQMVASLEETLKKGIMRAQIDARIEMLNWVLGGILT